MLSFDCLVQPVLAVFFLLFPLLSYPFNLHSSVQSRQFWHRHLKVMTGLHDASLPSVEPLRSLIDSFVLLLYESSHPPPSGEICCSSRLYHIQEGGSTGAAAAVALSDDRYSWNDAKTPCIVELTGHLMRIDADQGAVHIHIRPSCALDDGSGRLRSVLYILSRVMLQRILFGYVSAANTCPIRSLLFYSHEQETPDTHPLSFTMEQLFRDGGCPQLFASLLESQTANERPVEMSNMVDASGNTLAYIPRSIVHQFNILHSGVGILVCRKPDGRLLTANDYTNSDIYVHKRTGSKRIFPCLYDMFIGGVCMAGEPMEATAARELEEELNLKHAHAFLSKGLFSCTVCTIYNRCFVQVFSYSYHQQHDTIQWQPEEVEWGDFLSYSIVEKAASSSIQRLKETGTWPGLVVTKQRGKDDQQDTLITGNSCKREDSPESLWDFVPDGLLVWEAWQRFLAMSYDL